MRYTGDKQPSYDLYLSWLKAGDFAQENLVMRALAFNQKDLIAKIQNVDAAPLDSRAFPSDAVVGAVAAFMDGMPDVWHGRLAALLAGLSGPALKYWSDFNAGKVGGKAAAAMAVGSGKQIVRLPVLGSRGEFIQAHVRQMYRLDPTLKTTPQQLKKAIATQVRLLQIQGVKTKGNSQLGWYVVLDKNMVMGATAKNLTGQALTDELAKVVKKPEDLQKLDVARAAKVSGNVAIGATVLSGMLMVFNYTKLLDDVEKGMSHEMAEAKTKLMLSRISIAGFVSEQLGNVLEKVVEKKLPNAAGLSKVIIPNVLKVGGRVAGLSVGVILGGWDISKGLDARKSGDTGLSNAYFLSGGSATAIAITMYSVAMSWIALGPIGWILLALGVIVWLGATFFIESQKDNKLQEWISRCYFGMGSEKYSDTATQIAQYKLALAD